MHLKESLAALSNPKTKSVINYFFTTKCLSNPLLKTISEDLPLFPENLFLCFTILTIYRL